MRAIFFALILSLLPSAGFADSMDEALKNVGLLKADVKFSEADVGGFYGTELIPPLFRQLRAEPLRIPLWSSIWRDGILKEVDKPVDVALRGLGHVGLGIRRTSNGNPLVALEKKALGGIVEAIKALHGGKLSKAQLADLKKRASLIPEDLSASLAFLLLAEQSSVDWQKKAFAKLSPKDLRAAFLERTIPIRPEVADDFEGVGPLTRRLIADADLKSLAIGGLDLLYAIQKLKPKLADATMTGTFTWSSPLGEIVIGSVGNSTFKSGKNYLLIVDLDGDDTYAAGAGATPEHPVSVIVDAKGNDKYIVDTAVRNGKLVTPSFGAGLFGYGVLVDLKGNDTYIANRATQGRGDFGMGVLWDLEGDDVYDCYAQCQASAEFGLGLILDAAGSDKYSLFQQGQGFGGPSGAGILFDAGSGDDTFAANNVQIDFPAWVDKKFNTSLAQGFAFGFRSDIIDGYSLSGGFGALVDGGGNNSYSAGFFAQGFAYWYGVGLLSSGEGNDTFQVGKYALGASAHFGIGILHEVGGNDSYSVTQELGLGHGHDFAIGYLIDEKGDDTYNAPNFALGCASAQGLGFFWDRGGDDKYNSKEKEILGCASLRVPTPSTRYLSKALGVFLDTGEGKNTFDTPRFKGGKSSGHWVTEPVPTPELSPELRSRLLGTGLIE